MDPIEGLNEECNNSHKLLKINLISIQIKRRYYIDLFMKLQIFSEK